ncbi:MAG: class I SAM-dependent methyltransferase [Crocinitomicaceae bacterium]|nr:class I SAM-dependent methyltransferase [Crocinitomicaceae bacterium]
MKFVNDPIGYAIHDYTETATDANITVKSDLCEDDVLPIPYLFRSIDQMPPIEQLALKRCSGKILDIGAAAGCHSIYLKNKGFNVTALDRSAGACAYLKDNNIPCHQMDFMEFHGEQFDTILLLMNGIGLAGSLNQLPRVLQHLRKLLTPTGKILCDSTDINYMYNNDDGSVWVDLNANYYGEMRFNMIYKEVESGWFPWLYIDSLKLIEYATQEGFETEILLEGKNNHYLAELKLD